jgi:hypothetical protein
VFVTRNVPVVVPELSVIWASNSPINSRVVFVPYGKTFLREDCTRMFGFYFWISLKADLLRRFTEDTVSTITLIATFQTVILVFGGLVLALIT